MRSRLRRAYSLPLTARDTRRADDGYSVNELPASLSRLIRAGTSQDSDAAWRAFVAEHSRLVLHACRYVWRSPDDGNTYRTPWIRSYEFAAPTP